MANRTRLLLAVVAVIAIALAVAVLALTISRTVGGGDAAGGDGAGQTQGESPRRTAAPRLSSPPIPEGCQPMDGAVFDELSATLEEGSTVELSAMWEGKSRYSDEQMQMAAMMVRSPQGTINAPHLVWFNDDGTWVSVTAETVRDSSAPDGTDRVDRHDNPVSEVIGCMVNPHR